MHLEGLSVLGEHLGRYRSQDLPKQWVQYKGEQARKGEVNRSRQTDQEDGLLAKWIGARVSRFLSW